jgi:exopolyphosphatase / guanosine-5'-triphosphate,3'-diphosphate pyrophosphatase
MPRFAAIDVGSNASRLLVVEADSADRVRQIAYERIPVRLGHSVFLTGRLESESIDASVDAMRRFHVIMDEARVLRYRAVVTASAREADNSAELIDRIKNEAGIDLESIDGVEEARLVQLAVKTRVPLQGKRALLCDLGGGSLEVTEFIGDNNRFSTSLEIGTVRLLESFFGGGIQPITREQEQVVAEYLERTLASIAPRIRRKSYDLVVGTGGNFEAIAELAAVPGAAVPTIDVARARGLLKKMSKLSAKKRRAAYGLRADRADVIVPALHVLRALADLARTTRVVAPGVGLKEGIAYELVDRHFRVWDFHVEENAAVQAAVQLGRHYQFDEAHATHVDRIAARLFDGLEIVHKLGRDDRRALRMASLLHDVGDFVGNASHHKHTQYIIESSDIMGLPPAERLVVGCVARYHRRAMPSTKHLSYAELDAPDRIRVRKLAAILRLADALDRGHRTKVRALGVDVTRDQVTIHVRGEEDLSLEAWTVARKALLFESVFRRQVAVLIR